MRAKMRKTRTFSKILQLKKEKKRTLELEVQKMAEMVELEHSRLHAFEKEYSDTLDLFKKKNSETYIKAYDITSLYNYLSHIKKMMKEQKKIYMQKMDELASLRDRLIEAHTDKKVSEKLRDNAHKKELEDRNFSEQKEADFTSITRYAIKNNTG
jgi:flagellar export protein FliJ